MVFAAPQWIVSAAAESMGMVAASGKLGGTPWEMIRSKWICIILGNNAGPLLA
jgi:hypothetical protein